jgi:transposase-like protein
MDICPRCDGYKFYKNGLTQAGSQSLKCAKCKKTITVDPRSKGRKSIGDHPMTSYERFKKYRQKKKGEQND